MSLPSAPLSSEPVPTPVRGSRTSDADVLLPANLGMLFDPPPATAADLLDRMSVRMVTGSRFRIISLEADGDDSVSADAVAHFNAGVMDAARSLPPGTSFVPQPARPPPGLGAVPERRASDLSDTSTSSTIRSDYLDTGLLLMPQSSEDLALVHGTFQRSFPWKKPAPSATISPELHAFPVAQS